MNKRQELLALIQLIAECHEVELSEARAEMIASDLDGYSVGEINQAWSRYRAKSTNTKMPTAAQLLDLIPNGHPDVNESWAMIPKQEDDSVIWTEEMRAAYAVAAPFIAQKNLTGAFFAYKETYEKKLIEARMAKSKPKWSPSFGFNKSGRESAVIEAVEKQRISLEIGVRMHPEIEWSPRFESLCIAFGGPQLQIESKPKLISESIKRTEGLMKLGDVMKLK